MNQTMNDLALLCIGIGLGFTLSIVAVLVYTLWKAAQQMRRDNAELQRHLAANVVSLTAAIEKLRGDVSLALSRIDSERLFNASLAIQRSAKTFGQQVEQLQKVVFAQPPAPPIDWSSPGTGLDTEAEDDARMLADRARWRQETSQPGNWAGNLYPPANQPLNQPPAPADPLANLTPDERRQRTLEYFERKRAAEAGFPYPANPLNPLNPPATPPTAGSGAYASLLDESLSRPQPSPPSPDFSGLDEDEGAELVDKGELS